MMLKPTVIGVTLAMFLLPLAQSWSKTVSPRDKSGEALLTELVSVLNSKDSAKVKSFIEQHCSTDSPVQTRADRLGQLADRGAPFVFIRFGPESPSEVSALIEDKNKERFAFKMQLTADNPPRM